MVEPARVFLAAAAAAGVRRVVICSPAALRTAAAQANPHLAAKAEVERMVAASGLEHAILRCTHVVGPGSRLLELLAGAARPGEPSGTPARGQALVPGDGRQRVAPVWVGDVAEAIATADDAAQLPPTTWSLSGPTQLTFDDLVDAVRGSRVAKRHLAPGDGQAPGPWAGLSEVQAGVLAADSLADPALAPAPRLVPTPLAEALARSAGAWRPRVAGSP